MRKISYYIRDNHGSNNKLCRAISSFLQEEGMRWNPSHHRICCNGHILNLAVQAFLFGAEEAEEDETHVEEIVKSKEKEGWR